MFVSIIEIRIGANMLFLADHEFLTKNFYRLRSLIYMKQIWIPKRRSMPSICTQRSLLAAPVRLFNYLSYFQSSANIGQSSTKTGMYQSPEEVRAIRYLGAMLSLVFIISLIVGSTVYSFRIEKFCLQAVPSPQEDLVASIVEEISERSECIVFVLDAYYRSAMNLHWIQRLSLVSVYAIGIRESEDFFPPRHELASILRRSKDAGCNAYVILVSNGLQVSRFLEYTDKERITNTRGLFLFLHDWRLFNENAKYIWNRIPNVVFVRRFGSKRRSGDRPSRESFNLETVYYPVRVRQGLVITRYLDTWYRGKFRHGIDHFASKTSNLRRKALRVAIFQHIPAVTKGAIKTLDRSTNDESYMSDVESPSDEAMGVEFELMKIIARKINFAADFYVPYEVETARWGTAGENESYDGLLGEAVAGNAAFFIGDLHYTLRHHRLLDLSLPYNTECLTFLTPEALTDNSWKLLIVPFKLYTWIAVILTLILGSYTFHLFALTYKKYMISRPTTIAETRVSKALTRKPLKKYIRVPQVRRNEALQNLDLFTKADNSILYTYSMLLQVSLPRIPTAWAVRVFIGWWWLYSILVTVAYRASMTATLANPIGRVTIDTITELAERRIAVGGWADEQKLLFLASSDKEVRRIGERYELTNNEEDAIARVANGTFSYFENVHVLRQARAARQEFEYAQIKNAEKRKEARSADRDLHIMGECLIDMPVAIGMDKNSPLKPQVDRIVRRVIEAGFVNKWLSDVTEWSRIVELRYKSPPEQTLVNLHKLHGAFVALAIGFFFSILALAAEKLHWKYIVMRNPAYDKYQMDVFYANAKRLK